MSNDGKDFERLVQLVEQSISPGSHVEHNVDLPVIGSKCGNTRQCDVVIRSGQAPRETVTIVEVQDRKSKPEINTYGGWLHKLEQVGAQHLICVSRHDFPCSIKEDALGRGATVRLVTVKEDAGVNSIPIEYLDQEFEITRIDTYLRVLVSEAADVETREFVEKKMHGASLSDVIEECWSLDTNELESVLTLIRKRYVLPVGEEEGEGSFKFDLEEGPELYLLCPDGQFLRVGLSCTFSWLCHITEKPVSVFSYEQNEAGILAWIAEVSYESRNGLTSVKVPLIEKDGRYTHDRMGVRLPEHTTLTIKPLSSSTVSNG